MRFISQVAFPSIPSLIYPSQAKCSALQFISSCVCDFRVLPPQKMHPLPFPHLSVPVGDFLALSLLNKDVKRGQLSIWPMGCTRFQPYQPLFVRRTQVSSASWAWHVYNTFTLLALAHIIIFVVIYYCTTRGG